MGLNEFNDTFDEKYKKIPLQNEISNNGNSTMVYKNTYDIYRATETEDG